MGPVHGPRLGRLHFDRRVGSEAFNAHVLMLLRHVGSAKSRGGRAAAMRFSAQYDVTRTADDDWFDPLLHTDTRLFPDPFRVYADTDPFWADAHDHLLSFFDVVLSLVKEANGNDQSPAWKKAKALLLFPEPWEFCLGHSKGSPKGSGAGPGLQKDMLSGARTAVGLGFLTVEHMELLVLFQEGMGADRIGDVVCNVLKGYFIKYTQKVAARHGVPTKKQVVRHSEWDAAQGRWDSKIYELPFNPSPEVNGPILLAPERFLRGLPTVDADDFWSFAWENVNEELRANFNYDLAKNVPAKTKARMARQNPDLAVQYLGSLQAKEPYDVADDPDRRVRWWEEGAALAAANPLSMVPSDAGSFPDFVESVIKAFAHGIEHSDGWRLLHDGNGKARDEKTVQAYFRSAVVHYCRANKVDLTGEADAGRGPMDFKFVANWSARAGVEIKLTNNSKFWNGVKHQLPEYLTAEELKLGFFVAVAFTEKDLSEERQKLVRDAADAASEASGKEIRAMFVSALPKKSASKLTDKDVK